MPAPNLIQLKQLIQQWGKDAGFSGVAITDTQLAPYADYFQNWLKKPYQGDMQWLHQHAELRLAPQELHPDTARIISFSMEYLPSDTEPLRVLNSPQHAYISRYALGGDYHKMMRKRLSRIAENIREWAQDHRQQRAFVDSAPVLEKPLGEKSGLGWIGKNTLLMNKHQGSWFFLGEIFTTLPLPVDTKGEENACGKCKACLTVCPTNAFPRPYELDASRCISYLTIEHKGAIDPDLRGKIGNRVFGCDDCQLVCPWNKYAKFSSEDVFKPRHTLDSAELLCLWQWSEAEFLEKTAGSPIRRTGYERWSRNLAIGIGNGPATSEAIQALQHKEGTSSMVNEHVQWAITALKQRGSAPPAQKPLSVKYAPAG